LLADQKRRQGQQNDETTGGDNTLNAARKSVSEVFDDHAGDNRYDEKKENATHGPPKGEGHIDAAIEQQCRGTIEEQWNRHRGKRAADGGQANGERDVATRQIGKVVRSRTPGTDCNQQQADDDDWIVEEGCECDRDSWQQQNLTRAPGYQSLRSRGHSFEIVYLEAEPHAEGHKHQ